MNESMELKEVIGKTIRDIHVKILYEFGGLDTAKCFITLDDGLVLGFPFVPVYPDDPVWGNDDKDMADAVSIKKHYKEKYYKEVICRHLLGQRIVDFISYEDTMFDKTFIELENGYLINEITIGNHGTGAARLWIFKSIEEVEARFGTQYERLTEQINRASGLKPGI